MLRPCGPASSRSSTIIREHSRRESKQAVADALRLEVLPVELPSLIRFFSKVAQAESLLKPDLLYAQKCSCQVKPTIWWGKPGRASSRTSEAGPRQSFPLRLTLPRRSTARLVACLGFAAHVAEIARALKQALQRLCSDMRAPESCSRPAKCY